MKPSVYLIRPLTDQCREWLEGNLEYKDTYAGGVPIEYRYLQDILEGMAAEGFKPEKDFEVRK